MMVIDKIFTYKLKKLKIALKINPLWKNIIVILIGINGTQKVLDEMVLYC